MKRIAVLGSGEGTNLSAIVGHVRIKNLAAGIFAISDVENSGFLRRAKSYGIPNELIDRKLGRQRQESLLLKRLKELSPDLVVLAGYMRILPPAVVEAFRGKMINLHPALLPAFKGAHAIEDALSAGVRWTGVTVHFVDVEVDSGRIIAQMPVPVLEGDTADTLRERIHRAEHAMYPEVVEKIIGGEGFEGAFECQR